ncbi:MAG: ATP-binding protein [Alcanivorax sp.]|nr:ATP-binding protein [Alcanivorax sp.]
MNSPELKIVFTGPMGAGKTTAINQISDEPCVSTEVANNDLQQCQKDTTTTGLDYGYVNLPDGNGVRLYGTPGQERFRFMWPIIATNAAGIVLLLNGDHPELEDHLALYLDAFTTNPPLPLVIGVGRLPDNDFHVIDALHQQLANRNQPLPVIPIDVRNRDDVLLLIDTLLGQIEASNLEFAHG